MFGQTKIVENRFIDNYLSTCSLLLGVKDVYVDNEVKSSEPGILTLFIALQ